MATASPAVQSSTGIEVDVESRTSPPSSGSNSSTTPATAGEGASVVRMNKRNHRLSLPQCQEAVNQSQAAPQDCRDDHANSRPHHKSLVWRRLSATAAAGAPSSIMSTTTGGGVVRRNLSAATTSSSSSPVQMTASSSRDEEANGPTLTSPLPWRPRRRPVISSPYQEPPHKLVQMTLTSTSSTTTWTLSSWLVTALVLVTVGSLAVNLAALVVLKDSASSSQSGWFPVGSTTTFILRGGASRNPLPLGYKPRVVYFLQDEGGARRNRPPKRWANLLGETPQAVVTPTNDEDDSNLLVLAPATTSSSSSDDDHQRQDQEDCQPMAAWQTQSFVNCNTLHEIDMLAGMTNSTNSSEGIELDFLGQGWFRTTWRLDQGDDSVVLKTLRLERDFVAEFYELHRRDAVAMERLTSSKFVISSFGFCGQSAINERANFNIPNVQSLEVFNRKMRRQNSTFATRVKLRMAAAVATGLADIHGVAHDLDGDDRVALTHYDINPRNVALFEGGRPKINDFNIAEFLYYNPKTNETCPFPSRMHEPWWRAPEEMNVTANQKVGALDEKVDIYALGNVLYHILTTHAPRGKMKKERADEVRKEVAKGTRPNLPEPYKSGTSPIYETFRRALDLCFPLDPKDRATARDVADLLLDALVNVTAEAEEAKLEEQQARDAAAEEELDDDNDDDDETEEEEEDHQGLTTSHHSNHAGQKHIVKEKAPTRDDDDRHRHYSGLQQRRIR